MTGYWVPKEDKKNADIPDHLKPSHTNFSLHEQDRAMIRDNLVDAITAAPDAVRIQLLVCARVIIRYVIEMSTTFNKVFESTRLMISHCVPYCIV